MPSSRNTSLLASSLIANDLYQQQNASFKPVSLHTSRFGRRSNQLSLRDDWRLTLYSSSRRVPLKEGFVGQRHAGPGRG